MELGLVIAVRLYMYAGITTLLTTCTLALTGRAGIPKVAYSTALDVFLLMCFFFVFAAIVEYAGVNYFTKGAQNDFTVDSDTEVTLSETIRRSFRSFICSEIHNQSNI